jgi:hypothetical protein
MCWPRMCPQLLLLWHPGGINSSAMQLSYKFEIFVASVRVIIDRRCCPMCSSPGWTLRASSRTPWQAPYNGWSNNIAVASFSFQMTTSSAYGHHGVLPTCPKMLCAPRLPSLSLFPYKDRKNPAEAALFVVVHYCSSHLLQTRKECCEGLLLAIRVLVDRNGREGLGDGAVVPFEGFMLTCDLQPVCYPGCCSTSRKTSCNFLQNNITSR